ncbi:hypothetical protein, partial [Azospirillum brasilense]|uniref:hypothetical protein n=1 Tax=Azospirillum brasilense TaxID=192 RepID=UPI00196578DD
MTFAALQHKLTPGCPLGVSSLDLKAAPSWLRPFSLPKPCKEGKAAPIARDGVASRCSSKQNQPPGGVPGGWFCSPYGRLEESGAQIVDEVGLLPGEAAVGLRLAAE